MGASSPCLEYFQLIDRIINLDIGADYQGGSDDDHASTIFEATFPDPRSPVLRSEMAQTGGARPMNNERMPFSINEAKPPIREAVNASISPHVIHQGSVTP